MHRQFYDWAAALVLLLHLTWIVFVITGAFFTRNRPRLTALHLASLLWGIIVETGPWPCPLTLAENFLEARAGVLPYSGGFLLHYLDLIVYPDLSSRLLTLAGVAVCAINLGIYLLRFGAGRLGASRSGRRATKRRRT